VTPTFYTMRTINFLLRTRFTTSYNRYLTNDETSIVLDYCVTQYKYFFGLSSYLRANRVCVAYTQQPRRDIIVRVLGHAMAQAVSRRPLTAEAPVQSRVSPCEICGAQSGPGMGFFPSSSVFPSISFHRCSNTWKNEKLIIFITGLHNKPQGCGVSVASAAGPFTTNKSVLGLHVMCQSLLCDVLRTRLSRLCMPQKGSKSMISLTER
jgi:hypothetical protein